MEHKGVFELPEGYREIKKVDMQSDKKLMILINGLALVIILVLFFAGGFIYPFSFEINGDDMMPFVKTAGVVILCLAAYIVGHELVHGIFIKKYSGRKAKYGFTGMYAYAGTDAYFPKREYIIIALAPVVAFGILFLLLNIFLPKNYFWFFYILQGFNLSGAAGDFYITRLMGKLPEDTLVHDEGIAMKMYSQKGNL